MIGTTVPTERPGEQPQRAVRRRASAEAATGAAGALGTSGNRDTPPEPDGGHQKRQDGRTSRSALKTAQRKLAHAKSSRQCWFPSSKFVQVDVGRQLVAHVSNVHRCGSPWSCPMCAPVVRERRAQEIDRGCAAAIDRGWGVEFVTLTVRHHQGDELAPRLDLVSSALQKCLVGGGWRRLRAQLGYVGAIRAVEITHGANGWHPHNHALLIFDRQLTKRERIELRVLLLSRWAVVLRTAGFGTINGHGVDVRQVHSNKDAQLGAYLSKVEGGWSAGLELARADLKNKSTTPVQLLREAVATGELRPIRLWQEYERATFGKRAIVWSPGLRAQLLPDDEVSDVEAAAAEGADSPVMRALVAARRWRQLLDGGSELGRFLADLEHVAAAVLVVMDAAGVPLRAIDAGHRPQRE